MKKIKFFIALAFSFVALAAQAQDAATTKGDLFVDAGVGFFGGNYGKFNYGSTWNGSGNSTKNTQLPTLSVSVQKAFWDDITIGGQVAFNIYHSVHDLQQTDGYYQHSTLNQSNLFILGRGEYHFNRLINWPPKYDLYAGVLAGSIISTTKESKRYEGWGTTQAGAWRNDYPNRTTVNVGPTGAVFGGVRYYFKTNLSVFAEGGYGLTLFRTGLCWKM